MTANIFGQRFLGYREPAWHGLGQVFHEPMTAVEAVKAAGLDYRVEAHPVLVDLGGVISPVTDRVAVVREPTADDDQYRVLGIVSSNYEIVQNEEIAIMLDQLTQTWPVETIGALGHGERIFMTLDAGNISLRQGVDVRQFFLVTEGKDGTAGLNIAFTPVRVVCQNTLATGLSQASVNVRLCHRTNVKAEFQWRIDLLRRLQSVMGRVNAHFDTLLQVNLSDNQAKEVFAAAYPEPKVPGKVQLKHEISHAEISEIRELIERCNDAERDWLLARQRNLERQNAAWQLWLSMAGYTPVERGTAWAAFNVVAEIEDWREKTRGEDPLVSALFGARAHAKARAFAEALRLAQRS